MPLFGAIAGAGARRLSEITRRVSGITWLVSEKAWRAGGGASKAAPVVLAGDAVAVSVHLHAGAVAQEELGLRARRHL